MRCPTKQKLVKAMSQLDHEVANGNLNEGAHLRMCKHLKDVYDAHTNGKNRHIQKYLTAMLVDNPLGSKHVPCNYRHIMQDHKFLWQLLCAKRKKSGAPVTDKWWDDFMEGFVPEWMLQDTGDDVVMGIVRMSILVMLNAHWNTIEVIERRLNKLGMVPATLFPLNRPRPVNIGDEAAEEGFELDVWYALASDARFVRWLLKDSDTGYSHEDAIQLREYAFEMADKATTRDEGWQRTLGLRNLHDVVHVELSRMLGHSFEEAREMALAQPV